MHRAVDSGGLLHEAESGAVIAGKALVRCTCGKWLEAKAGGEFDRHLEEIAGVGPAPGEEVEP